ncbi:hypothetical protein VE03_06041 [Pseudogymnoascus sp. 23342-1-I1]|nr:hypothetical protein VE03_06041 [Pseudogymnoascus sp. 23342-1-I1]
MRYIGLEIIIADGRYFVYSQTRKLQRIPEPEDLIVDKIPVDPKQYREWLKKEREDHSKSKARLDAQICTISEVNKASLMEFADLWEPHAEEFAARPLGALSWPFDHRGPHGFLERPPHALLNKGYEVWMSAIFVDGTDELYSDAYELVTDAGNTDGTRSPWTYRIYTINLDRETFSVNNRTFYNLWDIPQFRKTGKCPQALPFNIDFEDYFGEYPGDRGKYQTIYNQYNHSVVNATNGSSNPSVQQAMSMMFFEKFTDPYTMRFWEYASSWGHKGFAFREFAFALLSIATGRYFFIDRADHDKFAGYDDRGYIIDRNGGEPLPIPIFGLECHEPGVSPGSAPAGTLYWFENVLVSLVPDSVFRQDTEAAIAKAVEFGFETGKTSLQIILFSIFNVMLLEAYVKDGVKVIRRTGLIPIQDRDRKSDWTVEPDRPVFRREADIATTFQQVCHKHAGFAKLQNFFDVAARRNLPSPRINERLPIELYANIISYADHRTLHAISQVSWALRRLCQERFAFSDDLDAVEFDASLKGPSYTQPLKFELSEEEILEMEMEEQARPKGQPELCLNDLGTFTFRDCQTGLVTTSGMDVKQRVDYELRVLCAHEDYHRIWCPIIGDASRPSLIVQIMFHLNF